uniref:C2H2-type domain-containing protein n=1 Tax=Timema monikensis TaxID=170555 RepID=A0A7R9E0K3_9NEOP|nr:unnamed protein product [Timema monikensis]
MVDVRGVMEKVSIQAETFSKNKLCRLCANSDYYMLSIFEGEGLEQEIEMKIHKYLPIQINNTEVKYIGNLEQDICTSDDDKSSKIAKLEKIAQKSTPQLTLIGPPGYTRVNNFVGLPIIAVTAFSCEVCHTTFTDTLALAGHKMAAHSASKFQCNFCDLEFNNNNQLEEHEKIHRSRIVECPICGKTVGARGFKLHLNQHKNTNSFVCITCVKVFPNESELKSHMSAHSHEKQHLCETCGKSFNTKTAMMEHVRVHLNDEDKEKFECDTCHTLYSSKNILKRHIILHDKAKEKKYACETCGKTFFKLPNLRLHIKVHSEDRPFKCSCCSMAFKWKKNLDTHTSIHGLGTDNHSKDNERIRKATPRVQCEVCGKYLASKWNLSVHMKRHNGNFTGSHMCHICGKTLCDSQAMSRHLKVHMGIKPFECKICNKHFGTKMSRDDHERTHTGEKPFCCDLCGKCFGSKPHLHVHRAIHSDERPYHCPYCPKAFRRRPHLVLHVRTHTGEKPFACEVCSRAFVQKNDMTKHMLTHSSERPFVCECGEVTLHVSLSSLMSSNRMKPRSRDWVHNYCENQFVSEKLGKTTAPHNDWYVSKEQERCIRTQRRGGPNHYRCITSYKEELWRTKSWWEKVDLQTAINQLAEELDRVKAENVKLEAAQKNKNPSCLETNSFEGLKRALVERFRKKQTSRFFREQLTKVRHFKGESVECFADRIKRIKVSRKMQNFGEVMVDLEIESDIRVADGESTLEVNEWRAKRKTHSSRESHMNYESRKKHI